MGADEKEKTNSVEDHPRPKPANELPFMLDFALSVTQLVVILTGLITLAVSLFSGAVLGMAAVRAGVAVLAVGLVLWLVNYLLARNSLEAVRMQMVSELERTHRDGTASTVEKTA
jgi:hypothetical protein